MLQKVPAKGHIERFNTKAFIELIKSYYYKQKHKNGARKKLVEDMKEQTCINLKNKIVYSNYS